MYLLIHLDGKLNDDEDSFFRFLVWSFRRFSTCFYTIGQVIIYSLSKGGFQFLDSRTFKVDIVVSV